MESESDRVPESSARQTEQSRVSLNNKHSSDVAIQDPLSESNDFSAISESDIGNRSSIGMSNNDNGDGNTYTDGDNSFTAEQEELLKKRYEEGYDLFIDPDYVRWIKLHYPDFHLPTDSGLICDLFTDVVPVSPIAIFENSRSPCSFLQLQKWSS